VRLPLRLSAPLLIAAAAIAIGVAATQFREPWTYVEYGRYIPVTCYVESPFDSGDLPVPRTVRAAPGDYEPSIPPGCSVTGLATIDYSASREQIRTPVPADVLVVVLVGAAAYVAVAALILLTRALNRSNANPE
jgi:hypothetical protein